MTAPIVSEKVTAANLAEVTAAAWNVALRLQSFGYKEIAAEMHISLDRATDMVRRWEDIGQVRRAETGKSGRILFECVPGAAGKLPEPARGRTAHGNLWTAMRGLRSFTPTDLAAHATTEDLVVTRSRAQSYAQALLAAGYLRVARKASPAQGREALYSLIRETGPKPPKPAHVSAVIDPNNGAVIVLEKGRK